MSIWLALVEAGILDASWGPKWVCACCATEWGWAAAQLDHMAGELADALTPFGSVSPEEVGRPCTRVVECDLPLLCENMYYIVAIEAPGRLPLLASGW